MFSIATTFLITVRLLPGLLPALVSRQLKVLEFFVFLAELPIIPDYLQKMLVYTRMIMTFF